MIGRFLEDFAVGQTFRSGRVRIDTEQIKTFGAEFGPQPFHLEEEAARDTIFRGLAARGPLRGFVGTVSEAIDLIGQYQDAGIDLLINADRRNDVETRELFASDVMPHFAS